MSEESHHHGKHEIIIVKRHKGDHDGAHGGAWKIAYADFMTAMMAFFLIMWLVNAANEETKAAVASYFNPIKLTSEVPPEEGIQDPKKAKDKSEPTEDGKESKDGKADKAADQSAEQPVTTETQEVKASEADYFENPYAVIADIAQETEDKANMSIKGDGGAQDAGPGTGADGGEAFRDPFDPDFWTQQVEVSKTSPANAADTPSETAGLPGDGEVIDAEKPDTLFKGNADKGDKKSGEKEAGDLNSGEGLTDKDGLGDGDKGKSDKAENGMSDKEKNGKSDKELQAEFDKNKDGKLDAKEKKLADAAAEAAAMQADLRKALGGKAGYLAEGLTVTPAEGGMLISITDATKTAMFRSGSAIPTKETVYAIDRIARLLKDRKGLIAIRGHTDARPYASKNYDNWRLSTARAQSAYFMLVRGGIAENRISQISGFADHRPKLPDQPLDAANRRIEILLQADPAG
jgi:chemotaxis protein MotB